MTKLFKYELRRLLVNKFFLGLLLVAALYSWHLLETVLICGVANTAPFSGWSYGAFLADMLPILLITLLFFVSFLYTRQEQGVRTLTDATPIDPRRLGLLRCGAMVIGFLLITAVPVGLSLWFYAVNFCFTHFGSFILPTLITLLPAMFFMLGMGISAGRLHPGLVYALMPLVLLLSYFSLPYAVDLFGNNFFQNFPDTLSLEADEPAFLVPESVWAGKVIYALIGIILMRIGLLDFKKEKTA